MLFVGKQRCETDIVSPSEAKVDSLLTSILIKIALPSGTKLKLVSLQPLEKSEVSEASTAVMYIIYVSSIHLNHPTTTPPRNLLSMGVKDSVTM